VLDSSVEPAAVAVAPVVVFAVAPVTPDGTEVVAENAVVAVEVVPWLSKWGIKKSPVSLSGSVVDCRMPDGERKISE